MVWFVFMRMHSWSSYLLSLEITSKWYYNNVMANFSLRLPDELYKALKEVAKEEERTINAQIVYILKHYIEDYFKKKQG